MAHLQAYINQEMSAAKVQGLSIAIVDDQGVRWSQGFGWADREHGLPANEQSRFTTDYGIKVNFNIMDEFDVTRSALIGNKIDISLSLFEKSSTMASVIANQYSEASDMQLAALTEIALVLFAVTLLFNVGARVLVWRTGRMPGGPTTAGNSTTVSGGRLAMAPRLGTLTVSSR